MERRLLLIGGGHSHVQVLEGLASNPLADCKVTVVVDRQVAIYSGMVPGYVAGQYRRSQLEIDVPRLAHRAGIDCIVEPVVRIDAGTRTIRLHDGRKLAFEWASVNIGSTVAGQDLPGISRFALPTRPISKLVQEVDRVIEEATQSCAAKPFRILVVGGGAGGIELAFTLRQRISGSRQGEVRTTIVHGGTRILEGYPESLAQRIHEQAAHCQIEIECGRKVVAATPEGAQLDNGEVWPFDVLLWVTGAVSHPLFRDSGLPTDERGFVRTRSTLQIEGHDHMFAVGDCATLIDHPATPKAGVYAVRQGPVLTRNLRAALANRSLEAYEPQRDFLTLLNLGDGSAVGAKWGKTFQGRWVMVLKDRIDQRFMGRFQI